jgi:hypothetical protein
MTAPKCHDHVLLTMKGLNRADTFSGFYWMRGALALVSVLVAALALSGCMGRTAPIAMAIPYSSANAGSNHACA